jgi:hypothetical protein
MKFEQTLFHAFGLAATVVSSVWAFTHGNPVAGL